jgi:hypothetical protein
MPVPGERGAPGPARHLAGAQGGDHGADRAEGKEGAPDARGPVVWRRGGDSRRGGYQGGCTEQRPYPGTQPGLTKASVTRVGDDLATEAGQERVLALLKAVGQGRGRNLVVNSGAGRDVGQRPPLVRRERVARLLRGQLAHRRTGIAPGPGRRRPRQAQPEPATGRQVEQGCLVQPHSRALGQQADHRRGFGTRPRLQRRLRRAAPRRCRGQHQQEQAQPPGKGGGEQPGHGARVPLSRPAPAEITFTVHHGARRPYVTILAS